MATIINATTTGLIVTPDATGVLQLASGTGNLVTVPSVTGTAMVSGNMPAFSVYRGSSQNISNNTITKIQFNTEEFDTANAFDPTTNYRFTPQVAGYYQINLTCYFTGSAMTNIQLYLYKNGSNYKTTLTAGGVSITDYQQTVSTVVYLNGSTDYIEGYGYLTASSGHQFYDAGNGRSTYMTGVLVRSA